MFSQWTRRVNEPRLTLRKLTLLGRAIALVAGELLFNAVCWIAAGICFGKTDGILGLALLAWVSDYFKQRKAPLMVTH